MYKIIIKILIKKGKFNIYLKRMIVNVENTLISQGCFNKMCKN